MSRGVTLVRSHYLISIHRPLADELHLQLLHLSLVGLQLSFEGTRLPNLVFQTQIFVHVGGVLFLQEFELAFVVRGVLELPFVSFDHNLHLLD
jgi:hypothetical protein